MNETRPPILVSERDVAERLGVRPKDVEQMAVEGVIPFLLVDGKRRYVMDEVLNGINDDAEKRRNSLRSSKWNT